MEEIYLTLAQRKALKAVDGGKVRHVYGSAGNLYRAPEGIDPRSVRKLETLGLIADTRDDAGSHPDLLVILTAKGRSVMERLP